MSVVVGVLPVQAQSSLPQWETVAGTKMAFDVASIKQNKSSERPRANIGLTFVDDHPSTGGLFSVVKFPLSAYIGFAYKLTPYETQSLTGQLPKWAASEAFDIEAHATQKNPTKDQMRLMMQSLLSNRFQLAVHVETRQLPMFALVLTRSGKTGPQLQPHSEDPPCPDPAFAEAIGSAPATPFSATCGNLIGLPPSKPGRLHMGGRNLSMRQIAGFLFPAAMKGAAGFVDREVVDQTDLAGNFDFDLEFTPEFNGPTPPNFQPDETSVTFPEALQEQLGLKLVPQTGPVDVLVIDHVEEPSEN